MKDFNGFIKIHRQLIEWEWYSNINCRITLIHCILKANFKDKRWQGHLIKRGSFATSLSKLSDEIGISVKALRIVFEKLEKTGEIIAKGQGMHTLVTVVNFDNYQKKDTQFDTTGAKEGQDKGKGGAKEGQQLKNDKKEEERKEKSIEVDSNESTIQPKPLEFKNEYLFVCEQFTSITGKGIRNKKTDALISRSDKYKMIKARLKEGATVEEIIKVIEIKAKEWKGTDWAKYLRFNTLFNKKNFEGYLDELESIAPASSENHPDAPTEPKQRFNYFRAIFERYKPHLEKRIVNTEYRDRIYQKRDAEGLIRDLERQNPKLLELCANTQ